MNARACHYILPFTHDGDYESLMTSLLQEGEKFCVIREPSVADASFGLGPLEPMRKYLVGQDQVVAWPGTALTDGAQATQYTFEFSDASLPVWLKLVDGLFSETKLGFEDLHIVRGSGSPVFASISSHSTAWLQMDDADFESWKMRAPENVQRLLADESRLPGHVTPLGALAGGTLGGSLSASDLGRVSHMEAWMRGRLEL